MTYLDEVNAVLQTGDILKALELTKQNEAAHGDEADFYTARAMICVRAGQDEAARKVLTAGVQRFPHDAEMWMNLAYLNSRLGDVPEAVEFYVRAKTMTSDEALRAQLDAAIAAIAPPPAKRERTAPLCVETIHPEELPAQHFARDLNNPVELAFLVRRVEFGVGAQDAEAALAQAVQTGSVSFADMEELARCAPRRGRQMLDALQEHRQGGA